MYHITSVCDSIMISYVIFTYMKSNLKERKIVDCAGCIVYKFIDNDIQLLLIRPRKDSNSWGIPKGHLERHDKNLIECAKRETYEETGLVCHPNSSFKLKPVYTRNPLEIKRVHAYLANHINDNNINPVTKNEVFDINWFSVNSLPQIHRYQLPLIEEAICMLRNQYKLLESIDIYA